MGDFLSAIRYVLENEGGYSNNPNDTGGETYQGISRVYYPDWVGWVTIDCNKPIKQGAYLHNAQLRMDINMFYKKNFWDKIQGDFIQDQHVDVYLMDFYVHKKYDAVKCLQKVVGEAQDGGIGTDTLTAINNYQSDLLTELYKARVKYYTEKGGTFVQGFLNRATNLFEKLKNNK